MAPRAPNFFQFSLAFPLIAFWNLCEKFLERLYHPLLLALTQAIDPLMVVVNGFPYNLAFRFGKPRRGVIQAPDGRLVEREGHFGRCHTATILPYHPLFDPGNVWNRREDQQYYKQLFGKPRIGCETPRARVYTMFGILMIFFWMAY
jgi:hypothetical protein